MPLPTPLSISKTISPAASAAPVATSQDALLDTKKKPFFSQLDDVMEKAKASSRPPGDALLSDQKALAQGKQEPLSGGSALPLAPAVTELGETGAFQGLEEQRRRVLNLVQPEPEADLDASKLGVAVGTEKTVLGGAINIGVAAEGLQKEPVTSQTSADAVDEVLDDGSAIAPVSIDAMNEAFQSETLIVESSAARQASITQLAAATNTPKADILTPAQVVGQPTATKAVDQAIAQEQLNTETVKESLQKEISMGENAREKQLKNDQNLMMASDKTAKFDAMLKAGAELSSSVPTTTPLSADISTAGRDPASPILQAQTTMPKLSTFLNTPVTDPRWQNDFSQRVSWIAKQGIQEAEIKMTPAHLGRVEIRISINEEQQASVMVYAKQGAARDAIDASLPRLREMLSAQGIELSDVNVSEHSLNDQRQQLSERGSDSEGPLADTGIDGEADDHPVVSSGEVALDSFSDFGGAARVDFYA